MEDNLKLFLNERQPNWFSLQMEENLICSSRRQPLFSKIKDELIF